MPIEAEFEEKDYELFFNDHISVVDHQFWSPGQVMEGHLGFDGAAMLVPSLFDEIFFFLRRRPWHLQRGVTLNAGFVSRLFGILDSRMPPYRFNFFAQHKRPTYVFGHNGGQWKSWGSSYFRYDIDQKQNHLLCKIASICGAGAVVSYCCAAFYTRKDLWNANKKGLILQKSNYAPPNRLSRHHTHSFKDPGGRGFGHSEEEEINGKSFEEFFLAAGKDTPPQPASMLTISAGEAISKAFSEIGDDMNFARSTVASIIDDANSLEEDTYRLLNAVANIIALRFAFGTSLILMTGDH
jgi:hypothetical protein